MNLQGKTIVITGASSGIGKELAFQLAKKGARVVLAARNVEALQKIADQINQTGGKALSVPTDVSHRQQMDSLAEQAVSYFGSLDIWVANAGVSLAQGPLIENKEENVRATMETNFMGGVYGVWAAVPHMEKTGGMLVFVTSGVGKRGVARNAVYCASKFAIHGLSEAIRTELVRKKIHVLTVAPPGTDTSFFENNKKGRKRDFKLYPVKLIARMIVKAIEKNKREVLLTKDVKLLHYSNFFFPKLVDWAILKVKG